MGCRQVKKERRMGKPPVASRSLVRKFQEREAKPATGGREGGREQPWGLQAGEAGKARQLPVGGKLSPPPAARREGTALGPLGWRGWQSAPATCGWEEVSKIRRVMAIAVKCFLHCWGGGRKEVAMEKNT